LPLVEDYLVEKKEYSKESLKITFKMFVMDNHADIVSLFCSREFGEAIQCSVALKKFVTTTGMVETEHGYQNTIGSVFNGTKHSITEYLGEQYPPKLSGDQFVARLIFELRGAHNVYQAIFVANHLEIVPKPSQEQIVKVCIRELKKRLAEEPRIFLQSAKTKFSSGILDFLSGRYRAVPHNVYYATHDLIRSLSIWSDLPLPPKKWHNDLVQKRLMEILDLLVKGNHKLYKNNSLSNSRANYFEAIDKPRYAHLVLDLYEMRQLADYQMHFEMGEFLPKLSNLMLKVEELFALATYIPNGSMRTHNDKIVLISYGERDLEPLEGSDYFDWLNRELNSWAKKKHYNLFEKGLILADGFSRKELKKGLLSLNDVYFSPYRPLQGNLDFYFKYTKDDDGLWRYSGIIEDKGQKPEESGYTFFDATNIKDVSNLVKKDEIKRLDVTDSLDEEVCVCDGKYFFVLSVMPDGRFFYFSPLSRQDADEQVAAMAKMRERIINVVTFLWEYHSTVSFSPFCIIP
jgi:hypothetical protein